MINLFEHQKQVLDATKELNRVAYYLDMGLGKTFVGSEKLMDLNASCNLVICQKSKIDDWIEHFSNNYPAVKIYDLTKKSNYEKLLEFIQCNVSTNIFIINYELAWRRKDLLNLNGFTLLLDESSLIQNDKAKQTKFILKLHPTNVILLSGTPTAGKYENLWSQGKLLGWDITKATFNNQYINWELLNVGGMKVRVVKKFNPYKNVERLKRKFREHGAVFMKTEKVLNLPEQTFIKVEVHNASLYQQFIKNDYAVIDDVELLGNTSLTKRLYARQLASQYNKNKMDALIDLLSSTNDRLIIFYNFNAEYDAISTVCKALNKPISVVNGSRKDLYQYEHESAAVTLVQYQAGAMGLNLQLANKVIYFSLPERSELFEQSKKRIHRIGQEKPCFYYLLLAKSTVDFDIYNALLKKQDYTDELFKTRWCKK